MDLSKYQELSGVSVSSAKSGFYTAQINRCLSMLETMLGFTLTAAEANTNLYNELGKTQTECSCSSVSTEDLLDPDLVVGSYRLYRFNRDDLFLFTDPFKAVNQVKLVVRKPATDGFITVRTFDPDMLRVNLGRDGIGKYIERCIDCVCVCDCDDCVQLAVDADWIWGTEDTLPDDLLYVLVDMVTHYTDAKRNIKSESITTHSYSKFDNTAPELLPTNLAVIKKYAGPNGSVTVRPSW